MIIILVYRCRHRWIERLSYLPKVTQQVNGGTEWFPPGGLVPEPKIPWVCAQTRSVQSPAQCLAHSRCLVNLSSFLFILRMHSEVEAPQCFWKVVLCTPCFLMSSSGRGVHSPFFGCQIHLSKPLYLLPSSSPPHPPHPNLFLPEASFPSSLPVAELDNKQSPTYYHLKKKNWSGIHIT